MQKKSWYRLWFDSPYYHILYKDRDDSEAASFISALLSHLSPAPNARFLDLACGRGRHSIFINQKGYNVTGLDLSEQNIRIAKELENENLKFEVHDMREKYQADAFDYVLNLFTSFGYFSSTQKNQEVLSATHYNLKNEGLLIIDFLNIEPVLAGLVPEETKQIQGIEFKINRVCKNGRITKTIKVKDEEKELFFSEEVQALHRRDFEEILEATNFRILNVFGDYSLGDFHESTSPRLIIVAQKK